MLRIMGVVRKTRTRQHDSSLMILYLSDQIKKVTVIIHPEAKVEQSSNLLTTKSVNALVR